VDATETIWIRLSIEASARSVRCPSNSLLSLLRASVKGELGAPARLREEFIPFTSCVSPFAGTGLSCVTVRYHLGTDASDVQFGHVSKPTHSQR